MSATGVTKSVFFDEMFLLWMHFVISGASADCIFKVTNNATEKYQPVPLYNISSDYHLAVPHQGSIRLEAGQNLSLLCSGNRNYVKQTNANISTVTCIEGDAVKLFRDVYKFEEIRCKNIVRGEVRATRTKCGIKGNGGVTYQIGYPPSRRDWVTLISVCYIPEIGHTSYTRHVIHGKEIKYASKSTYRPDFSTSGLNDNITASLAYKQAYQKSTFSSILGSSLYAGQYINSKSFLARGHLSPDADFLLASAQFSTYYYINAAPQWQAINAASWKSIESTVRNLAAYYGDLEIITGTHGILIYNDVAGNPQPIFLSQTGMLPVPKYFWKMAYDAKSKKAITFVILNDPYVQDVQSEIFCKDICEEYGFNKKSWKDSSSGYVFCCSVSEFRREVMDAPKLAATSVMGEPSVNVQRSIEQEPASFAE